MKRILVGTDFSTRSDRALRRATLLSRTHGAEMLLVHVVDDDQAARLLEVERRTALSLLEEQAQTLRQVDGIACATAVLTGDPYETLTRAAEEHAADLIVIGPYRRHLLEDTFVGTTAELIIKASRRPVLMTNGVPTGFFRHVLVASDLGPSGRDAVAAVQALGIDRQVGVSVLHVVDSPITSLLVSSSMMEEAMRAARMEEEVRASRTVSAHLAELGFSPLGQLVVLSEGSIAGAILSAATNARADMIVVGTECRTGLVRLVLGSVAEEVLRRAEVDVLAVAPSQGVG